MSRHLNYADWLCKVGNKKVCTEKRSVLWKIPNTVFAIFHRHYLVFSKIKCFIKAHNAQKGVFFLSQKGVLGVFFSVWIFLPNTYRLIYIKQLKSIFYWLYFCRVVGRKNKHHRYKKITNMFNNYMNCFCRLWFYWPESCASSRHSWFIWQGKLDN